MATFPKSVATFIVLILFMSFGITHTQALTIPYFAYGSNCYPPTMTDLRRIQCVDSEVAVLPGYQLKFNLPGMPGFEPSFACVETCPRSDVHGVLYRLTPQDFARVSLSEGVPMAYQWRKVEVIPYVGDGQQAGQHALESSDSKKVEAYTLVSNNPLSNRDIPPSKAYLNTLVQGAKAYRMDASYLQQLEATPTGKTLLGDGLVAGNILQWAEQRSKSRN